MSSEEESLDDLKYLLGNMGIEILFSIDKGAKDIETMKLFSGLPLACIKGRIPVLLDLKLIERTNQIYYTAERGKIFLKHLQEGREKSKKF